MKRIGVFGSSFNPPTLGHQDVIDQVIPHFDEILLVPSLSHPFQKPLAPIHHRLEMLRIFLEHWQGDPSRDKVRIFNIEETLQKMHPEMGPIYTYDVLSALTDLYQKYQEDFQIFFIIGPDIRDPLVWQRFYRYEDIEKKWPLFVVKERIPIHSTKVREIMAKYRDDPKLLEIELTRLVGQAIARYILNNHLYVEREYAVA